MDLFSLPINSFSIVEGQNYSKDAAISFYMEYCILKWDFVDPADVLGSLKSHLSVDVFVKCFYDLLVALSGSGVKSKWVGSVHVVCGVPGSGKTTLVSQLPSAETQVVVPFRSLRDKYRDVHKMRCLTVHSAVSNVRRSKYLVFDEVTCQCLHLVESIILIVQPKFVYFVGDFQQCWLLPSEGLSCRDFLDSYGVSLYLNINRRNPCGDVKFINSLFPNVDMLCRCGVRGPCDCVSCGDKCSTVDFFHLGEGMSIDVDAVLCFSNKTKSHLDALGFSAITVRAAMGSEFDRVGLFYLHEFDRELLKVDGLVYVGLTRTLKHLSVFSDIADDDLRGLLRRSYDTQYVDEEEGLYDWFGSQVGFVRRLLSDFSL